MTITRTTLTTLITLLIAGHSVLGQNFHPPITNYSPKDYGKLRTPENWDVTQDHRGLIYSGGGNGVLEFDGNAWRYIDVKNGAYVVSLDTDEDGIVFVGSQDEFGYLAATAESKGDITFVSLRDKVPEEFDTLGIGTVWETICTPEGVYFHTEEVILKYHNDQLTTLKPRTLFHRIFYVDGRLYTREKHRGLSVLEGNEFKPLPGTEPLAEIGVFGLIKRSKDFLLVTRENGLWSYNPQTAQVDSINLEERDELVHAAPLGAIALSSGDIAVNTIESGVLILTREGHIKHRIDKRTGIRVNDVKAIFEDREDNLWLALNNGLSKVNYNSPLSFYAEESKLEGSVQCVARFHDTLVVGTSSGLFFYDNDRSRFAQHFDLSGQVWDFFVTDSALLIGSGEGLYRVHSATAASPLEMLDRRNCNAIDHSDKSGHYILAGSDGFLILDEDFFEVEFTPIGISGITDIVRHPAPNGVDDEFWIGTNQQGIVRIRWADSTYQLEAFIGEDAGLIGGSWIRPFLFEGDVLYGMPAPNGLSRYVTRRELIEPLLEEGETIDDYPFVQGAFSPVDLRGEPILQAISHLADSETRAWACIDEQIMYFDKLNDFSRVNRPFWGINFGRVNRFMLESDDVLWIGTADGLIKFEENDQKEYEIPFHAVIRRVTTGKRKLIYAGGLGLDGDAMGPIELEYEDNTINFDFAAPYFEDNHKVLFSFKLEGHDDGWSDWSSKTEAPFTTLREGTYVFKVKAMNIYGQESSVASFTIEILPPWYRTTLAYVGYALLGLIVIFLAITISIRRLKRKNERLEEIVAERTVEIRNQNTQLQQQKDEIEHQQQEIMDSINYAKRIQEAILPVELEIKENFKDSFVLFMPKDIVSGDFYWFARVGTKRIVVCADCTGHGVPGAFMSMIGTDKLNHIVKARGITNPSEILAEMNKGIKASLKQNEETDSTRDGMDAAICTVDFVAETLEYAGANRSLWHVRDNELIETKPTKVAVAGFTSDDQVYELHQVKLQTGDRFYMSSDGYADQFGGTRGKKLKVKVMKELVMSHYQKDMETQRTIFKQQIIEWMGEYEQVDDICVIGLEI